VEEIKKTDKSALSLILYPYQFEADPNLIEWNESELSKLRKISPLDKLIYINQHIKNYLKTKDIDLSEVLPSIGNSNEEKEVILASISKGIQILVEQDSN